MLERAEAGAEGSGRYQPMTLAALADAVREEKERATRWRLFREFLKEFRAAPPTRKSELLAEAPAPVDSDWDALLGAAAEHLAWQDRLSCPAWTQEPRRFLRRAWFTSSLPTARMAALETSPASFRRRGVFLERSEVDAA